MVAGAGVPKTSQSGQLNKDDQEGREKAKLGIRSKDIEDGSEDEAMEVERVTVQQDGQSGPRSLSQVSMSKTKSSQTSAVLPNSIL